MYLILKLTTTTQSNKFTLQRTIKWKSHMKEDAKSSRRKNSMQWSSHYRMSDWLNLSKQSTKQGTIRYVHVLYILVWYNLQRGQILVWSTIREGDRGRRRCRRAREVEEWRRHLQPRCVPWVLARSSPLLHPLLPSVCEKIAVCNRG